MPDPHPTAEELSAHLDQPSQEVADHASDCRSCAQDLGRLQRVSRALGEILPVDAETRAGAIASALDQVRATPAPVRSLDAARRRRAGRLAGLGAAAAVTLGAVLAVGTLNDLRSSDDGASTTALRSAPEAATGEALGDGVAGTEADLAVPGATDEPPAVALVDLGPTENVDQVRAALAQLRRSTTQARPTGGDQAACEAEARRLPGLPDLADLEVAATSTFDGVPSVVLAFGVLSSGAESGDSPVVTVLALEGCRELARSVAP